MILSVGSAEPHNHINRGHDTLYELDHDSFQSPSPQQEDVAELIRGNSKLQEDDGRILSVAIQRSAIAYYSTRYDSLIMPEISL